MARRVVYLAAILLAVLHQDFWLWHDATLLFGFLPVGLAYHIVYTLAAAGLWYAAVRYAWPGKLSSFARGNEEPERRGR